MRSGRREADETDPALTPREREIVGLIAEGRTSGQIASLLGCSPLTVRKHRANVLRKLGLRSASGLVAYATGAADAAPRWPPEARPKLTARETEIAGLLQGGMTSKEIGRRLSLSDATVRKHRERLHRKLGVRRLADLLALLRGAD